MTVLAELEAGRVDAGLGGSVYKQRVARQGGGKRGGYRVLLFFRSGERVIFYDGFAKSDLDNIRDDQLAWFKEMARYFISLTDKQLDSAVSRGEYIEF
ncbi:MAG: type II toxin-antitoxin system RelE/ParE family toxin [Treponematales bacterium]